MMNEGSAAAGGKERISAIVTLLEAIGLRPWHYLGKMEADNAGTFLAGFRWACFALGVPQSPERYRQAVQERGWEPLSSRPWREMKERGLTPKAIIDELIAIEIAAWRRTAEKTIPLPEASIAFLFLPEGTTVDWDPAAQSLSEYVLLQEAAIESGATLTRAGLQALAPMSPAHFLAGDLGAGVHVLALLHRLLDKTSGNEDLVNGAMSLSGSWTIEARRFLGWEDRTFVLLDDFPGCERLIPLFQRVGLGIKMLRDVPPGVDLRELMHVTEAVVVRDVADAKFLLS